MNVDPQIVETCRGVAAEEGTPDFVLDAVIQNLKPSIRLIPQPKNSASPGVSHIGGLPDLPSGIEWPRYNPTTPVPDTLSQYVGQPLSLLMQVNLAAIPESVRGDVLPTNGLLLFFYLDVIFLNILEDRADMGAVVCVDSDSTALTCADRPADLSPEQVFRCYDLLPRREITVPSPYELGMDDRVDDYLGLWETLAEEVESVQGFGPWYSPKHRMLGHAQLIQGAGLEARTDLLLQVDSDARRWPERYPEPGMMWGDGGRIYFLINDKDLLSTRFHKASTLLEMS